MATDRRQHRIDRQGAPTLRNWDDRTGLRGQRASSEATVDCGWGTLIFAHTFGDNQRLADTISDESPKQRNIALYIKDPHVILSLRPQELFLDPSHTYRLWLYNYRSSRVRPKGFQIRRMQDRSDAKAVGRLLATRNMVPVEPDFLLEQVSSRVLTHFVAVDTKNQRIIGTVMGVDHKRAFDDTENGSSLWALAVDPQAALPGVGRALVSHLADHFQARARDFMDLSVMYDNEAVISLYNKMGFQRIPVFCIKRKNAINEPLYVGTDERESELNPYARIIVDEARRRGIAVTLIDPANGYFSLRVGAKSVVCRESLSELTSAIAMSRCDNKDVSIALLREAGLSTPLSQLVGSDSSNRAFLERHGRIVVKPVRGEQGNGVTVGISTVPEMDEAIRVAARVSANVMLETFVAGDDLRIIVIDGDVVAAAIRRPAEIIGNGVDTAEELIEKQSRRRRAATDGESSIPVDATTRRCLREADLDLDAIPNEGDVVRVRDTANLHTGGTLHDVTEELHPELARAAERAARTLNIPVVGIDMIVAAVDQPDYWIIEANERPGLANHEPQPTAERFVDLLFPQTVAQVTPQANPESES
ncbi:MAG TPA: N-acetylglutaminylglutamine synthetase [Woeseiaceae bacterium]|nr:N-acetylglutaminylglutamine synthetase [Woeseiaceae bacterium]